MSKKEKLLLSMLVVGITAGLAAFGVFSAFSSQTSNPGNNFTAGTVNLSDNDGDVAAYNVSGGKPTSTQSECVRVVYTGSLDSDIHLYTPETIGSLGGYVNLTIQPGTQTTPNTNCTGSRSPRRVARAAAYAASSRRVRRYERCSSRG